MADGRTRLIQCKCYSQSVNKGHIVAELEKLVTNIFERRIPHNPSEVCFYVVPGLTSKAQDLLEDQSIWQRDAESALTRHLGESPGESLLTFAENWWPAFDRESDLALTDRVKKIPALVEGFFAIRKCIVGAAADVANEVVERLLSDRFEDQFGGIGSAATPADLDVAELGKQFELASQPLLTWPSTIGNDRWIERPELGLLTTLVEDRDSATVLLLGCRGSGKSALLAGLAKRCQGHGHAVLAIKADELPVTVDSAGKLAEQLYLPALIPACVRSLAESAKVVVLLDQLDALASLADLKSDRLHVLLDLIPQLIGLPNVIVVSSCRTFECENDIRLGRLKHERICLAIPPWSQVERVLDEHGYQTSSWPGRLRDTLQVPQHLKILLRHYADGSTPESTSYFGMLDELWDRYVTNPEGSPRRAELLTRLANDLTETEGSSAPLAKYAEYHQEVEELERVDFLRRKGARLSFQHQSLLEHASARGFLAGNPELSKWVQAREESLFIRPTLWNVLGYLRDTASSAYESAVESLFVCWKRIHVKYLVVEFLGQIDQPTDIEHRWLGSLFTDEELRGKVLSAVSGNEDWFRRLLPSQLPAQMTRPGDDAWPMIQLLSSSWVFARDECLNLIERHWLHDQRKREFALRAFEHLTTWCDRSVRLVERIIGCGNISRSYCAHLAHHILETAPGLAPRIVGASLKADIHRIDSQAKVGSVSATQSGADTAYGPFHPPSYRELLEQQDTYDLPEIATRAPQEFVYAVWEPFLHALKHELRPAPTEILQYRGDHCMGGKLDDEEPTHFRLMRAVDVAVTGFAEKAPDEFCRFVQQHHEVDSMLVQRLFCRGFAAIAQNHPRESLAFLLADNRRFALGRYDDEDADTRALISNMGRASVELEIPSLETAILHWSQYRPDGEPPDARTRFDRSKYDRQRRLRLLLSIPQEKRSASVRALVDRELTAIPKPTPSFESTEFARVASPMSADQMERATNADVLGLLTIVPDSADHYPKDWTKGGSVEIGRELESFAGRQPARMVAMLAELTPDEHQKYAAYAIAGLAQTPLATPELLAVIVSLDERGFAADEFRCEAGRALGARAHSERGLDNRETDLLTRWLTETHPSKEEVEVDLDESTDRNTRDGALLFSELSLMLPSDASYWILDALTLGLLMRDPPELDEWLDIIEAHAMRTERAQVWQALATQMRPLCQCDPRRVRSLMNRLCGAFPRFRDSVPGIRLIMDLRRILDGAGVETPHSESGSKKVQQTRLHNVVKQIRTGNWSAGSQAYGELIGLFSLVDRFPWALDRLQEILTEKNGDQRNQERRGVAYAAARLWCHPGCRTDATETLIRLLRVADRQLAAAVMDAFVVSDSVYADDHSRQLIRTAVESPHGLEVYQARCLVDKLHDIVHTDPDLVVQVAEKMLDLHGQNIADIRTAFAGMAANLTQISLSLLRLGAKYRTKGLDLFERLLVLDLHEARRALTSLDEEREWPGR